MGLEEKADKPERNLLVRRKVISTVSHRTKKKKRSKNIKQIFILSFDALRERKARSVLTILMVVVGSSLMVALNGMSGGQNNFINKPAKHLGTQHTLCQFWSE